MWIYFFGHDVKKQIYMFFKGEIIIQTACVTPGCKEYTAENIQLHIVIHYYIKKLQQVDVDEATLTCAWVYF